ncbi:MAG: DEAD/DEAH box helicase family protein [Balneolaceae bacterium]
MAEHLHEALTTGSRFLGGKDYYQKNVPEYIFQNLKKGFGQRHYQKEAFGRFVYYLESFPDRPQGTPTQILYHMATGSGKTLIMAGLMVYLYTKGYRNFLFFVDSTNIIEKTRDNFLNPVSSKYLFADRIQIEDQQVRMNEVDNFSAANPDDINIAFTTIQGLHSRLNTPRENSITFDDFENEKIVLISDEAHHINAETKSRSQRNQTELENLDTWEGTVNRIVEANDENVMLEFTATIDLSHPDILNKYKDRIIFDYPLKEFRIDGYSKEVKVLQADLDPIDRALQAVILSQYRLKKFAEYRLAIKPVVMFKANYVNPPSKPDKNKKVVSSEFREEFQQKMRNLAAGDLESIKSRVKDDSVVAEAFRYFEREEITLHNLALELKEDFTDEKCISVDSITDKAENQILVNSLEDAGNPIRVVFAVDALNEGWDVLNLFDIVRLYDTRDAKKGKPGKTTMAEAQLIGRGARYCPFLIEDDQPLYQRKYDVVGNEEEHELKICEELYYHSAHNPRYIDELHTAMEEIGIKPKRSYQISLNLKDSFKETDIYREGKIFTNERIKYNREDIYKIDDSAKDYLYKVKLRTGYMVTTTIYSEATGNDLKTARKDYRLSGFHPNVVRKALHRLPFYHFSSLKSYFPHLKSLKEFIISNDFLAQISVEVSGPRDRIFNLSHNDQLDITVQVLEQLASKIKTDFVEYKGTRKFKPYSLKDTINNKTVNIVREDASDREYGERQSQTGDDGLRLPLDEKEWYAFNDNFGTSEEKRFVKYIDKVYDQLKSRYDTIYLVRNERHIKLYSFDDGQALEPDFILFLKKKKPGKELHYQIFIEPKGGHLIEHDLWKEEFLKRLKEEFKLEQVWKGEEYVIWGLPFYNEQKRRREFEDGFGSFLE